MLHLGEPIHKWDDRHACCPHFRRFGDSHHRHVSAVAASRHHEFLLIDVAALHHEINCRKIILKIATAHIETIRIHELLAESGRAAIIGRYNSVALIDQILNDSVEAVYCL